MARPLFEGPELRAVARSLAAFLLIVSGMIMLFQTYSVNILPPTDGFLETSAVVTALERTGTFRDPSFLVSLRYQVPDAYGIDKEINSSRRVDFEIYYHLNIGDEVIIHYQTRDPFDWLLLISDNRFSHYALGIVIVLVGLMPLIFPLIFWWGARQDDFELTDEWDTNSPLGAEP